MTTGAIMLFDTEKGARPFTLYTVDFHINILLAKNPRTPKRSGVLIHLSN
jgi:hypothetical protein